MFNDEIVISRIPSLLCIDTINACFYNNKIACYTILVIEIRFYLHLSNSRGYFNTISAEFDNRLMWQGHYSIQGLQ